MEYNPSPPTHQMRLIRFFLAVCLFLPFEVSAQGRIGQAQLGTPIGGGDIEHLNPARVLLDHKKDLRLDQGQISSLETLRKAFDADGKVKADSIRKAQRAITAPPPLTRRPPEGKPETRKDSL